MSFEGVVIDKLNGGLGRTSSAADRVIALVYGMDATESIANYTAKGFYSITEVEAVGITYGGTENVTYTSTDTEAEKNAKIAAEKERVRQVSALWYHFDEMFRLAPGQEFYLITVPTASTVDEVLTNTDFINAVKSIDDINVLGFANISDLNIEKIVRHAIYETDGTTVKSYVSYATQFQDFVGKFAKEHLLIDGIFLEGNYTGSANSFDFASYDMRDENIKAANVSVVIAQDPAMSDINSPVAVGTVLGSVAIRKVHEDLGSVDIEDKPSSRKGEENYTLTDSSTGRWSNAQLSDGRAFIKLTTTEQANLSKKGYIYVGSFKNYGGFYLSGCPTAVVSTSDYAYFNFNCVWDKAARLVRTTLIPRVRSNVPVEASTGYIKSTTISYWEGLISKQLETMVAAGNISAFDVYINPAQAPSDATPLVIKTRLVTNRIVHEFEVELGLTTKLD